MCDEFFVTDVTGWPSNDVTAEIVRKPLGDPRGHKKI